MVDSTAPRLTFVRNPISFSLEGDAPSEVSLPVHPNDASMGTRTWSLRSKKILLEGDDIELMDLRLKEFADVALNDTVASMGSTERKDKRPIVHWLSSDQSRESKLCYTKDNEIHHVNGHVETHTYTAGTIVQLERIGYARVMEDDTLLLCHEEHGEENV